MEHNKYHSFSLSNIAQKWIENVTIFRSILFMHKWFNLNTKYTWEFLKPLFLNPPIKYIYSKYFRLNREIK